MAINATKALELRNKNNHNYLSMSAEEVSNSVIFRGSFADMNFNILSLLSSEGSEIKKKFETLIISLLNNFVIARSMIF